MATTRKFPSYKERDVSELIPYANNARTHSDEQVAQIAASIKEFGFINPVIVDGENGIVAGHGRVLAARKLGLTSVPTVEVSWLTDAQRKAYILADNKLALNAGWDNDLLRVELEALQSLDFDVTLVGFSDTELADLLADKNVGLTDPDDTPELAADAVSVLGDVWLLGRHRIICGDCTDSLVVDKVLAGVQPHLMVTDPPYGVEYDASWRGTARNSDGSLLSTGNNRAVGLVENDGQADWRDAWTLFPGDVAYVWHAGNKAHVVAESLLFAGFTIRAQVIWAKSHFAIGRGDYHPQHEPCWYAVKKGKTGHYDGGRKQSTLWHIDKPQKSETGHSTQKPVECMKRPIENNSSPGQAVYEPFSGSGTTIIACEQTGRACYAIELNPLYVDMAVKRWQDFTGKKARLESSGLTFEEVANGNQTATQAD